MTTESDAMAAALMQLADHSDRLGRLDEREAGHHQQAWAQLAELTRMVGKLAERVTTYAADQVAETAGKGPRPGGYEPAPVPRWWQLEGEEREEALDRLRGWVRQVYRPGYGQLAATLGACWDQHPLCLYGIDLLSELWSVLYLPDGRTAADVSAQAEFQARIVPAIAEQLMIETTRCGHNSGSPRLHRSLP